MGTFYVFSLSNHLSSESDDLYILPLTSLTYEGHHVACIIQVWLQSAFVVKRTRIFSGIQLNLQLDLR